MIPALELSIPREITNQTYNRVFDINILFFFIAVIKLNHLYIWVTVWESSTRDAIVQLSLNRFTEQ